MKTMKNFLSMAALALVGAMMTGCTNDEDFSTPQQPENKSNLVTLTTTVGFDDSAETRAVTGTGTKTFAVGDKMAVSYYSNTAGEFVKAVSAALTSGDIASGGKSATFTFTLDSPDKTKAVNYVYPAAMLNDDLTPNWAALNNQNGTLATIGSNLDYCLKQGPWNGENLPTLTLENQIAILAITLKDNATSNDITSTITGLTLKVGSSLTYAVTRSAAAGPIYVAIMPTSSANISITANDGEYNYTKSLTGKTYEQNNGYNVSWRMTKGSPVGTIDGKFTINGSGDQVYFAKGNLQATTTDLGANWTWGFAANQWDYIGAAVANNSIDGNGTVSANGTVDLFGWVGASSTWTGAAMYGISISTATNNTDGYGNVATEALKSDWGNTIGTGWRTLTTDEWNYVLSTRTTGGTVGGTSQARYTQATINTDGTGVNGLIMFPDGVDFAASEFTTLGTVNNTSAYATKCISSQWTALAAKGCVFLPAAGTGNHASVGGVGLSGCYWSSTSYAIVGGAYGVYFLNTNFYSQNQTNRFNRRSVRLVRAAN